MAKSCTSSTYHCKKKKQGKKNYLLHPNVSIIFLLNFPFVYSKEKKKTVAEMKINKEREAKLSYMYDKIKHIFHKFFKFIIF